MSDNYSIINGIKIISHTSPDTSDTSDTFTAYADTNDKDGIIKIVDNRTVSTPNQESRTTQNDVIITKNDKDIDTKTNEHSLQVSEVSEVSYIKEEQGTIIPQSIHRRSPHSDIWECDNCNWTGDIHFMKIHPCKFNKKKSNMKREE